MRFTGKGPVARLAGAALLAAAALLGACGQKGPLRLPEESGAVVTRPAPDGEAAPSGTEQKEPRVNRSDGARDK